MIILKKVSLISSGGGGPYIRKSEEHIYNDFVSFFFGGLWAFSFSPLFLSTYFRCPICDKPLELAFMYLPYLVTVAKECPLELEKRF